MITNFNDNVNAMQCIGLWGEEIADANPHQLTLPAPEAAARAVIQFYLSNADALANIASLSYKPIAVFDEFGVDPDLFAPAGENGLFLLNMAVISISGFKNIENFRYRKTIGTNVYVRVAYYR